MMRVTGSKARRVLLANAIALSTMAITPAQAQTPPRQSYDLPSQQLTDALVAIGRASGWEVIFSSVDVEGKQAPALKGSFTIQDAIHALLEGSGLRAEVNGGTIIILGRTVSPEPVERDPAGPAGDIIVTGSRIRGAPPTSPVTTITREAMRDAGQSDLGEVVRALTQNFSGGQNPGIAVGNFGSSNSNLNSASSLNLRGLGPDATLTLLNGRRLAYGGAGQAVDISAIPVDAVDRLEVVADGASALYGSDAVGGVANIILKRDYDGVAISGRWAAATDGGDVEQQYSLVAGRRWSTGGVIATFDVSQNTAITARQRSYTTRLEDSATLYPFMKSSSGLLSAHQQLGDSVTLSVDALYNHRSHKLAIPFTATLPFTVSGNDRRGQTTNFTIAPSLKADIAPGWSLSANMVHGEDRVHYSTLTASGGAKLYLLYGCYCNALTSFELAADGRLMELPAGAIRVAFGGGYRRNTLDYLRQRTNFRPVITPTESFSAKQESVYGYGELYVPLISPEMDVSVINRMSLTGALRYERYRGVVDVVTPKLGIVVAPTQDIEIKGSWGRSFKAPTLYQQYLSQDTYLDDVEGYGTGYPAGSTVLSLGGGSRSLRPERATNWTVTLALQPKSLPGLKLELSTFHIRYSERVTEPIVNAAGVLNNPLYRDLVTLAPSRAQIAAAINGAAFGLTNNSSGEFDPKTVVAIIDDRFRNVASQTIKGVDFSASYAHQFTGGSKLNLTVAASYLESTQQLNRGQPETKLAGTIFNPPHVRVRGGAVWNSGPLTLAGFVSHIGGVTDTRQKPAVGIDGQTPIDLTMRYRTTDTEGFLSGVEVALGAQNILNDKPSVIRNAYANFTPFDSTNYSAIGRFVSLTITKRW